MKVRQTWPARLGLYVITTVLSLGLATSAAMAAPYAAMVVDARTGEVLHARNADARLHPASLTKMMTLYIAFEAIERGEISLDTKVTISRNAAAEPPSRLGLRAGQKIALRYLIRAAAIKSANDAATAIGEAISGSEAKFAQRMTRTAKALGMSKTTFKNANGLTQSGHLSTARDMTVMGRHMLYDYPQYYNLFSRREASAKLARVRNTNRRLLDGYRGADGIKTGYTRAAGYNLVASAERGNERIIATVFGGRSTASRNAKVAELLDLGFRRAPSRVALRKPALPTYSPVPGKRGGKTVRVATALKKSLRPKARPSHMIETPAPTVIADARNSAANVDMEAIIQGALTEAQQNAATAPTPTPAPKIARTRPRTPPANQTVILANATPDRGTHRSPDPEIVTRSATTGGKLWGINVGRYTSRFQAEKVLLRTALAEMSTLDGARRKVYKSTKGFDAVFSGMTRERADQACRRLQVKNQTCAMIGPS